MKTIFILLALFLVAGLLNADTPDAKKKNVWKKQESVPQTLVPFKSEENIAQMPNNNMTILSTQSKVQNPSQQTQLQSNISKQDSDSKL